MLDKLPQIGDMAILNDDKLLACVTGIELILGKEPKFMLEGWEGLIASKEPGNGAKFNLESFTPLGVSIFKLQELLSTDPMAWRMLEPYLGFELPKEIDIEEIKLQAEIFEMEARNNN